MDRVARREKEHRRLSACLTQARENLPAIQTGNHHVQYHQIEFHFQRQVQPVQTISCHFDAKARFAKPLLQELCGFHFVFDNQNSHSNVFARPAFGVLSNDGNSTFVGA